MVKRYWKKVVDDRDLVEYAQYLTGLNTKSSKWKKTAQISAEDTCRGIWKFIVYMHDDYYTIVKSKFGIKTKPAALKYLKKYISKN